MDDARAWVDMRYYASNLSPFTDAELAGVSWTEEDLIKMQKLSDMGIELSITVGICAKRSAFV